MPATPLSGPEVVQCSALRHNGGVRRATEPERDVVARGADGPWVQSVTPVAPLRTASPSMRFLAYAGFFTGAWSGVLCLVVFAIGRAAGVHVIDPQGVPHWVQAFPWLAVLLLPVACGLLGAAGCGLVRGRRHAALWVWIVGTALAVASLAGPLGEPSWPARIMLIVMHAITWFLVVPQLARITGDSDPRASVDRRD